MKKKIIYGLLFAVAMVTASSSFVSCKDYEGDDYALLKEKIQADADLIKVIQQQLNAIKSCECDPTLADRVATIESDYLKAAALNGYATQAWVNQQGFTTLSDVQKWVNEQGFSTVTMEAVQKWVNEQGFLKEATGGLTEEQVKGIVNTILLQTLGENNKVISDMINTALANGENPYWTKNEVINYFNTNQPDLSGYATKEDINNLRNYIILGDSVKNAYEWADYAYQRVIAHSDSLKTIYNQTITNRDSIVILADSIDKVAAQALENFNTAKELADSAIKLANKALDSCNIVDAKVADLENAMKEADQKLQDQIDALEERVAANEKSIQNITGTLKKQITSIVIQGAYNPVFGYGAIPVGLQSNVLAAFYGTAIDEVEFPSADPDFYIGEQSWISEKEWNAMGLSTVFEASKGASLMSTEEGNAGTLYVTINPSNVDFSGTNFTMRSSDNKVSKMQLTELAPSDKQLTFGYTRANSINGFYEMKATVNADDAAALAPNFNLKSVGSSIVDVLKDAKSVAIAAKNDREISGARTLVKDLAEVAVKVYANSQDILPRLGLQANWIDEVTGAKSVTSKYEIAATAVQPLGFGSLSRFYSLNNISYTPTHNFIKYIDGQAIDKEIYDIIMENLKMDLNLNLGINLEFDEMNVHYTPLEPGEGAIPVGVLGLYLTADQINGTYWQVADGANGYYNRYQMIVCDDNGNPVILGYDNGQPIYQTSGIYILDGGGWMQQVYGYDYYIYKALDKNSNNQIVLDLTEYTNALLKGIYDDVEHELAKFNSQVDKINDVNNLEEKAEEAINKAINDMGINIYSSLSNFLGGYINRANNLISRLNGYANKALDYLINDPDRYVQPILLSVTKDKKMTVVGRSRLSASVANAGDVIALKPTTMTLETVAPAFKKHLAISNVYNNKTGKNAVYGNDADAKAVMDAANQIIGAKEVIDGGTQEGIQALKVFQVPANASGMTLEIVYTALGYDGKIAGKKFYIRVK